MKPLAVKVFVESDAAHATQFYSGLYMLQDEGLVKVSLANGSYHHLPYVRLQANHQNVFIDLADHSLVDTNQYNNNAFYFKRMLLKSDAANLAKLRPYGLNYPVYYKSDRTFKRSLYSRSGKHILQTFARSNAFIASMFNINLAHHTAQVHHFEQAPLHSSDAKVIFSARLWQPHKPKDTEKQRQRKFINDQRIAIVKEARARIANNFIGGIDVDEYAKTIAGDALLVDDSFSHKSSYLQALRSCSIGIATAGLEDSIGFKMAEYVCMSKAIVTSPIDKYLLPGNFEEGKNYLSFNNSARDCIDKCELLMNDQPLRYSLMENNQTYYEQYLRPDKLVWNLLKTVADA